MQELLALLALGCLATVNENIPIAGQSTTDSSQLTCVARKGAIAQDARSQIDLASTPVADQMDRLDPGFALQISTNLRNTVLRTIEHHELNASSQTLHEALWIGYPWIDEDDLGCRCRWCSDASAWYHGSDFGSNGLLAECRIEPQVGGHQGTKFKLLGHHKPTTKLPRCGSLGPLLGRNSQNPAPVDVLRTPTDQTR